jgi:CBS domain containing-hemolysin-like protein
MIAMLSIAGVFLLCTGLSVIAWLDRVYIELGRVTTGRVHANLDIFEAEIEPQLKLDRTPATMTFRLLSNLGLVLVAAATSVGVAHYADTPWEMALQEMILLTGQVVFFLHLIPYLLLTHTTGRWALPLVPVVRLLAGLVWPLRTLLEVGVSVAHLHEDKPGSAQTPQEGLEALVEAGEEQGILERGDAELIEQVMEFGDKRVREVMTPRPDVVAIPASASLEQLRQLFVSTRFSRLPVYEGTLDDVIGIAYVRDLLGVPDQEAARRTVREIVRPVIFVPETKLGSLLLREMQQKKQQMATAVDEYGNVAGVVTAEDLIEEIVGEIGEEDRTPAPDVVREADGSLVLRGSLAVDRLEELLGTPLKRGESGAATTVAGLVNEIAGHVPVAGEVIELDGLRFEVLDANQRKVLRLRARLRPQPKTEKAAVK